MRKGAFLLTVISFLILLLTVACNDKTDINIGDKLDKAREILNELEGIETVAVSFDGENKINFRLMVEEDFTAEKATTLFEQILHSMRKNSGDIDIWNSFQGHFDIISYDKDLIYEATKLVGKTLMVVSKDK